MKGTDVRETYIDSIRLLRRKAVQSYFDIAQALMLKTPFILFQLESGYLVFIMKKLFLHKG